MDNWFKRIKQRVYACDYSKESKIFKYVAKDLKIRPLNTKVLSLENLDYPNDF